MFRYYAIDSFSPTNYNWGHWGTRSSPNWCARRRPRSTRRSRRTAGAGARIVVDEAPWLFIVHDLNPRAMSKKVTGFQPAQSWYQDFTQITMA